MSQPRTAIRLDGVRGAVPGTPISSKELPVTSTDLQPRLDPGAIAPAPAAAAAEQAAHVLAPLA